MLMALSDAVDDAEPTANAEEAGKANVGKEPAGPDTVSLWEHAPEWKSGSE